MIPSPARLCLGEETPRVRRWKSGVVDLRRTLLQSPRKRVTGSSCPPVSETLCTGVQMYLNPPPGPSPKWRVGPRRQRKRSIGGPTKGNVRGVPVQVHVLTIFTIHPIPSGSKGKSGKVFHESLVSNFSEFDFYYRQGLYVIRNCLVNLFLFNVFLFVRFLYFYVIFTDYWYSFVWTRVIGNLFTTNFVVFLY